MKLCSARCTVWKNAKAPPDEAVVRQTHTINRVVDASYPSCLYTSFNNTPLVLEIPISERGNMSRSYSLCRWCPSAFSELASRLWRGNPPEPEFKGKAWMSLNLSGLLPNPVAYRASDPIGPAVGDFGIKLIAVCRGTCRHQDQQGQNEKDRFHLNSIPSCGLSGRPPSEQESENN
jgi:hypothetical protein